MADQAENEPAVCHKCNEEISTKILTALGKKWHPEHFQCFDCTEPIVEKSFHQINGEPICGNCFVSKHCPICYQCKQPIEGKSVTAMGQTWHEDHFVCGGPCGKPMKGQSFYTRDGKPFCKEDFEQLFAAKCGGCGKSILGAASVALDKKWHPECFKCKNCEKPITEDSFGVEDNLPVCTKCF